MAVFDQYMNAKNSIEEADEIIATESDKDMIDLAKMEKQESLALIPKLEEDLKILLIPKDPADDKMSWWSSVRERAVTRLLFSWKMCIECTLCIQVKRLETRSYRLQRGRKRLQRTHHESRGRGRVWNHEI